MRLPLPLLAAVLLAAAAPHSSAQTGSPEKRTLIWTLDWSPDDRYIAFGGDDRLLWIYDATRMAMHKTVPMAEMIRKVAWSPDGRSLLVSTRSGTQILDIENDGRIDLPDTAGARGLAWSPDGSTLATGTNRTKVWTRQGKLLATLQKADNKSLFSLAWHPRIDRIVTTGDEVIVYDVSGKQLSQFRHRPAKTGILTATWHPSGDFFVTGDYGHDQVASILQFWKPDGTLLKTLHGSKAEYRNVAWSKDGRFLASASDVLRVWTREGRLQTEGPRQTDKLWGIDWNSKGDRIATSSGDGKMTIWSRAGKPLKVVE
ncbi:MAG: hypothetical protein SFV54_26760 [Bryobacteraceae bacterium]|nr:hypothetical protein [Bryobacteraceae bacterium]